MTPLTQQLEDKKKEYKELYNSNHKNFPNSNICRTCAKMNRCQAEIAILEQAIAEKKKQRQEEIEFLKTLPTQSGKSSIYTRNRVKQRIKQLNQPKEEREK